MDCTSLKSITVPEGVTAIPAHAFRNMTSLEEIILPNTLTSIGGYAFENCSNLQDITLPANIKTIKDSTFRGCSNVVISIPREDSPVAVTLIDNEIRYTTNRLGIYGAMDINLDRQRSGYRSNAGTTMSEYVFLTASYGLKPDVAVRAGNFSLTIRIPSAETIESGTMRVNGAAAEFTSDNGYIHIPLTEASGTVSFGIIPDSGFLMSYAQLSYTLDGKTVREIVGIVNASDELLTISVPSKTRHAAFEVSGTAGAGQSVVLLVDGVEASTVTASRTGNYTGQIALPAPEDGKRYVVEARTTGSSGAAVTASASVFYSSEAPELIEFKMNYRGKDYDILQLDGTSPLISWVPASFTFRIRFNDNSRIDQVQVVSEKGTEEVILDCDYNAEEDCFIGTGFKGHVPGVIKLQYVEQDVNFVTNAALTNLGSYTTGNKTGHETEVTSADGSTTYRYLEELETGVSAPVGDNYEQVVSDGKICYIAVEPVPYVHNNSCFLVKELYTPEADGTYTVIRTGIGTEAVSLFGYILPDGYEDAAKTTKQMLDFLTDDKKRSDKENGPSDEDIARTAIRDYVNATKDQLDPSSKEYNELQEIEVLLWWDDLINSTDQTYDDIRDYIDKSYQVSDDPEGWDVDKTKEKIDDSIDEMDRITEDIKNENIRKIIKKLTERENVDGEEKSLLERIQEAIEKKYKEDKKRLNARYAVDPSGYVYEAVESNRLSGVTTTIYYTENPDAPDPVLWNAEEYDQKNPLVTDELGWYAWDVPEGWWQVKYEKDGYETAYSEWMPVPPPQLNVNVALQTTQAPTVQAVQAYEDAVVVEFDQYMQLSACDAIRLTSDGHELEGTWSPVDAEPSPEQVDVRYATTFRFTPTQPISGMVGCTITAAENYAGIAMGEMDSRMVPVVLEIKELSAEPTLEIGWKKTNELILTASPIAAAAGKTVSVRVSDEMLVTAPTAAVFDSNGVARIPVSGLLPGEAEVFCTIDGTQLATTVAVNVKTRGGPGKVIVNKSLQAERNGSEISFQITYDQNVQAIIVAAHYAADGKMVEVVQKPVSLTAETMYSDTISFSSPPGADSSAKLFVLDAATHAPLFQHQQP